MKKVVLLAAVLLFAISGFSQTETDNKDVKYRFGFNLGVNYSNLHTRGSLPEDASISNGFGFRLGALMDYSISSRFLFSPKVEFSLNNSQVDFEKQDHTISSYEVLPLSLEFMTHFVYKIGCGKTVPYILLGPNLRIPIPTKTYSYENGAHVDFAIDFGIGLDNTLKYFNFAPELRYSLGLLNDALLDNLYFSNIALVLNFK